MKISPLILTLMIVPIALGMNETYSAGWFDCNPFLLFSILAVFWVGVMVMRVIED